MNRNQRPRRDSHEKKPAVEGTSLANGTWYQVLQDQETDVSVGRIGGVIKEGVYVRRGSSNQTKGNATVASGKVASLKQQLLQTSLGASSSKAADGDSSKAYANPIVDRKVINEVEVRSSIKGGNHTPTLIVKVENKLKRHLSNVGVMGRVLN
ncbi:hypothetical protein V6N13_106655 [Hibiscus sabdariffa]